MGNEAIELQEWCTSWWHKLRYGSKRTEHNYVTGGVVEFFCNKCGKKTDGYTHFKLPDFTN